MKRAVAFLLLAVLLLGCVFPSFAEAERNPYLTGDTSLAKISSLKISTGGKARQIELQWSAVPRAMEYDVYRSATGAKGSYKKIGDTSATWYADMGLKHSTTYYYAVRAAAWNGEKTIYSPFKKANLSTRITKAYAYKRFLQTYKAMHKFFHAYREDGAIYETQAGVEAALYPFTLDGCTTKQQAVKYLSRYLEPRYAALVADNTLSTIDGKLYLWTPLYGEEGCLLAKDGCTKKISYKDTRATCTFSLSYADMEETYDATETLSLVYRSGKWVFRCETPTFWGGGSYAYR